MTTPQDDTLRILGRDYTVRYVPPSELMHQNLGLCDNKTQTISIAQDQTPIEAADTFLHETIHAIDWIAGLELSEHQVRHLAATLIGVLQDNPEFAEWLVTDKTKERKLVEQEQSKRKRARRTAQGSGSDSRGTSQTKGRERQGKFSYLERGKAVSQGQRY